MAKEGGYYLDVDILPAINKGLFSSVPDPVKFDSAIWERIYLEAIMKGMPDLIPGYSTHYYDNLSEKIRNSLQEIIEANNEVSKLFSPLGDISCNSLSMKVCTALGNNALISHPDSILSKLIIKKGFVKHQTIFRHLCRGNEDIEEKNK